MNTRLLLPALLIALVAAAGACDDDSPPATTDGPSERPLDAAAVDGRDGGLDAVEAGGDQAVERVEAGGDVATEAGPDGVIDGPAPVDAVDAAGEAGGGSPTSLNNCNLATADDLTAPGADRTIAFTFQDGDRCLKIRAGQSVTWNSNFATHPLTAEGGDMPSPITDVSAGTTAIIAFPNPGTFGYICDEHPEMIGAIFVIP